MFIVVGVWISPAAIVAVAVVAVVVFGAWWMLPVAAACGVLAVAAALGIRAWSERRDAAATAHWAVQRQLRAEALEPVAPPRRVTASGGVTIINNYFTDPPGVQMAPVIRSITGGTDGTIRAVEEAAVSRDHRPAHEAGQEGGEGQGAA